MSRMNESKRKVARQIQRLCRKYAWESAYGVKLINLELMDSVGQHVAVCSTGVVLARGQGCYVMPWRDYSTGVLRRFLHRARKSVKEMQ